MPRIYLERREMGEELRRLFDLLDGESQAAGGPGECTPPVDVIDAPERLEIVMDLPGVKPEAVQLVFARGTLVIAGTKRPAACGHKDAAFHMAERTFGRFARAVRISGAVDAGRATATLRKGELRISVPRIEERRGREIRIRIGTD
jgi:HSP20 family protein